MAHGSSNESIARPHTNGHVNGSVDGHANGSADPASTPNGVNGVHENGSQGLKLEPLAIVGMSCRLPGDVRTPQEFWELCARKRSGWSSIPESRFNASSFYHPNPARSGTFNPTGANFLSTDLAQFDAPFFNISLQEAQSLDPQQRILLECAYEALEYGGLAKEVIAGQDVGVFVGGSFADYELNNLRDTETVPMYQTTGNAQSILSNRISYFLDLKGPSFTVDTACSSSMVALHLACQSIRSGESSSAIVGSCHLNLLPDYWVSMSLNRLFSDSGRCYPFEHRGQSGYGRAEGCGVLVLKPLSAALANGDSIRAVIMNSGINSDGATQGISMPNPIAQERLIRQVYSTAGLDPKDTGYVEAHGTGTRVGDPLEASALHAVFGGRTKRQPLYVGSVKSNFGHTEGASGIVSVIKSAMMLERGFILPNCDFEKGKEDVPMDSWGMKVPVKQVPWPSGKKYISVNNFGYGGTNAHVILAKAPVTTTTEVITHSYHLSEGIQWASSPQKLFTLSANDEHAAQAMMKNLEVFCEQNPEVFDLGLMDNLAFTLSQRRSVLPWKVAISAKSSTELVSKLSAVDTKPLRAFGAPVLGFVFTGQGAQWHAMGRELFKSYPVFAKALTRCDAHITRLGSTFSLVEELLKDEKSSLVSEAHISQPTCSAVQIGLTDLFASWDIAPSAVVGHSSGEIGAAYAAGRLTLEDCMSVAFWRGVYSRQLEQAIHGVKGGMMAVGAGEEEIMKDLKVLRQGRAGIACVNSDSSLTISGDEAAILELEDNLKERSVFARRLKVGVAYHSHHMQQIADVYRSAIADITPRDSQTTFHSSVYGRTVKASELGPQYWVDNLVSTVQFSKGLRDLLARGKCSKGKPVNTLLELGPHPALEGPIKQILKADGKASAVNYVASLRRKINAVEAVQQTAATLFVQGQQIKFEAVNFAIPPAKKPTLMTNLPKYPWNLSQRYWHESRIAKNHLHRPFPRSDLLGLLTTESDDLEPRWRNVIKAEDNPWIKEHRVQGNNVYPLAGYIAMAIEASSQFAKMRRSVPTGFSLREISVGKALIVPDSTSVETMFMLRPYAEGTRVSSDTWNEFRVFAYANNRWDEHCRGLVRVHTAGKPNPLSHLQDVRAAETARTVALLTKSSDESVDPERVYSAIEKEGFFYHNLFRGIENCRLGPSGTVFDLTVPDTSKHMPQEYETDYVLHPTTLDVCIQAVWPLLGAGNGALQSLYLPSFLKSLTINSAERIPAGKTLRVYGTQETPESKRAPVDHSMLVVDAEDETIVPIHFEGLTMTPVGDGGDLEDDETRRLCYKMDYVPCFDLMDVHDLVSSSPRDSPLGSVEEKRPSKICANAAICVGNMAKLNPQMSILGLGSDLAPTALAILESLGNEFPGQPPRLERFTYTAADESGLGEDVQTSFDAWKGRMEYKSLDISADLKEQKFSAHSYDIVVAQSLLRRGSTSQQSLQHLHDLLKPGGKLLLLDEVSLTEPVLTRLLQESGFSGTDVHLMDDLNAVERPFSLTISTARSSAQANFIEEEVVIVRPDVPSELAETALPSTLATLIGKHAPVATMAGADAKDKLCIVLYELEGPRLGKLTAETFGALQKLLTTAAGVLWVVRGAVNSSPDSNLVIGLARSLRSEADLRFATLDLESNPALSLDDSARDIARVFQHVFSSDRSVVSGSDMEFVASNGSIMVPRVSEDTSTNDLVRQAPSSGIVLRSQTFKQPSRSLRMAVEQPGLLDTIYFTDVAKEPLLEDHIEIAVQYAGLNFKDVMHAMGQLHSDEFGLECSGVITQCGSRVTDLSVGDRVCAIAPGCVANVARCPATSAWKVPHNVSMEAASTVPIVFCTAYYSLIDVARLEPGEKILIHAAAGGVGQAAIMIAQYIGADVFATVGSLEKKEHLMKNYDIPENRIFYSRDTSFAEGIRKATGGVGVDVALNSLAGDSLRATWETIAPLGRFVEIGKRDIKRNSRLEMAQFDNNVSFSSVDLMIIANRRPKIMQALLKDVFALLSSGAAVPVSPRTCYSVSETQVALSSLQTGRAMGKVVLRMDDDAVVKVNRREKLVDSLKSDATYVIVGGTGGVGRSMAEWMAMHGARYIVLVSRSGGDTATILALAERLGEKHGTQVVVSACDMADKTSVEQNLGATLMGMPPVAGAVYSAMILRDVLFEKMTFEDYDVVLKAKLDGVWNLHNLLSSHPVSFFVTLSSLAGMVGNRGQAAYAATSTFMNSFVAYRRSQGLPCSTLDLAPVTGIGYLAENADREKVVSEAFGQGAVTEREIHQLLGAAIAGDLDANCSGHCITGLEITKHNQESFWIHDSKFASLLQQYHSKNSTGSGDDAAGGAQQQSLAEQLKTRAGDVEGMREVMTAAMITKVSSMLMRSEGDIHTTTSLINYGMDSLVAIEFRNWIAREMGASLQILEILAVESLSDLITVIMGRSKLIAAAAPEEEKKADAAPVVNTQKRRADEGDVAEQKKVKVNGHA